MRTTPYFIQSNLYQFKGISPEIDAAIDELYRVLNEQLIPTINKHEEEETIKGSCSSGRYTDPEDEISMPF